MGNLKYIKTSDDVIVIFPEYLEHSAFSGFNPTSAGFIDIYMENGEIKYHCWGSSVSLRLSHSEHDSKIAQRQFNPSPY